MSSRPESERSSGRSRRRDWLFAGFATLSIAGSVPGAAQDIPPRGLEMAGQESDPLAVDRAVIIKLFERRDVRALSVAVGIDPEEVVRSIESLEGEALRRAALQARQLGDEESKGLLPSPSTIILILLLAIILHIGA